jgi:hypothetical protein
VVALQADADLEVLRARRGRASSTCAHAGASTATGFSMKTCGRF